MEAETGADVRWALEHYGLHHDFCFRFSVDDKTLLGGSSVHRFGPAVHILLLIRGYIPER